VGAIVRMFQKAHLEDPQALLFLNDYHAEDGMCSRYASARPWPCPCLGTGLYRAGGRTSALQPLVCCGDVSSGTVVLPTLQDVSMGHS